MTSVASERFERAVAAIDAANADDPVAIEVGGVRRPKEIAHAELATEWVERLDPGASEALLLAARAHHVRRWEIPRSTEPAGRAGYLRWRRRLQGHHADVLDRLLTQAGYPRAMVDRVQQIVTKRGLGRDPEVQVFEDALCLVFLETQFADIVRRLGDDKAVDVTRKTLSKMSGAGRTLALELPLGAAERSIVERALA